MPTALHPTPQTELLVSLQPMKVGGGGGGGGGAEHEPAAADQTPALQLAVAMPSLPFVDVTVAVPPLSVPGARPEQVVPPEVQLITFPGQLLGGGAAQVPPERDQLPAEQEAVTEPKLPFVDVTEVELPLASPPTGPEQLVPP